ncbi:MAG TPA: glycerol kinase GlpK [Candidatus Scubalenecus merdavium]|uniref:Glycerol kinase n=1 Tax=Candidatus Scybalenecus merdavium TaxID=2840939 RepID=A0A9D1MVT2_9FIRM|nr:glycerol kinase GlpK [Candidatus Scubalenecus merdavium]
MKKKKYVLALDQGTTSSRAIIFDEQGEIVAKAQNEFTQYYPSDGWVEHDPNEILLSQIGAILGVLRKNSVDAADIAALGITNQRETTVVWDKKTGKPVYNAIVWQCRRTAPICEELEARGLGDYIKEKTGLLIDAYFSGTKIKWILDNVEGARARAERGELLFGTIDTWLIWNLTDGKVHVTDYSNACRTMLFDIDNLCWDETLCKELGIPMCMLPEVKPSSCVYGHMAKITGIEDIAGVPIAGACGDQPSALFGQGCFETGQAKNTYGTGCFLLMNTGEKRISSRSNLLSGVAWGLNGKVTYALEGSAFNAGSVIKWLRDELGIIESAPQCDRFAEMVDDANGLYFVPAFTGLGAPYWDMYARGTMIGLTRGTNKYHLCRAVLDSIAFQMTDLLEAMKNDSNIVLKDLRVDGGASVSDILMQIQADVAGVQVNRPKNAEATALGAAYLAGLAVGVWKDTQEIEKNRQVQKIFVPAMEITKRNRMYDNWKRAVERSRNWER